MSDRLRGSNAIVTGAGSGIGEAIARAFVREGARVVIAELDEIRGRGVADALNTVRAGAALYIRTDVGDGSSVAGMARAAAEAFGPPDVLVNNASVNVFRDPLKTSQEDWARCLSVDLEGAWRCSREVLPAMLAKADGAIINIASNHAERIIKGTFPYPVAKHGLIGLTRALALEYAGNGVAINAISPGWIDTPLSARHFADHADPIAARRAAEVKQPLGRLGRPEEIAAVALLLASREARFMTGSNLVIDGGVTIRMYE